MTRYRIIKDGRMWAVIEQQSDGVGIWRLDTFEAARRLVVTLLDEDRADFLNFNPGFTD